MGFKRLGARMVMVTLLLLIACPTLSAYRIEYKEQLYKMYHRQLYMYPLDIAENIHWLEQALRADFANPLNALAVIHTPEEWERYRNLFVMHLDLKLVELYLLWGSKYNKQEAYFFNAPFKKENLASLDKAEKLFKYSLTYWAQAKEYAAQAASRKWLNLKEVQEWEDEMARIQDGSLDYAAIVDKHLAKLETVRATFRNMDASTY